MSKKNQKLMAAVACVLATGTLFGGLVPTHAEGDRVTSKGKVDLTKFFQSQDLGSGLDNEDPGKRDEWFFGQRFGVGQKPNPNARITALAQAKKLPQFKLPNKTKNVNSQDANTLTWKNIGPSPIVGEYWTKGNVSGRVTSMAIAPNGTIYIGSAGGGVWSSKDGGKSWSALTDGFLADGVTPIPSLAIGSVAVSSDSNTIYAGTGENPLALGSDAYYGQGLLVSNDAGKTWNILHQDIFQGQRITSLVVDKNNAQNIIFGSTLGLFTSADGGNTLTGNAAIPLTDGAGNVHTNYQVTSIVQNGANVYAAVAGLGVFKSPDGGQSWAFSSSGLPTDPAAIGNTALAIAPSNPKTIYAGVSNQDRTGNFGALTGLYVSHDSGATWTQLNKTPDYTIQASYYLDGDYSQGWYDNAITVDPTNEKNVTIAGIGIYKTTDGGNTWSNIVDRNSGIHPDEHTVNYDKSGNLLIGNDGGVFEITKSGQKLDLNSNLVLTQDYPGMSIFNNGQQVLTGAQDNGSQMYYGPQAWKSIWTGDGAQTLSNPTDPNSMFISYVNGDLYKTTNGGANVFADWTYAAPSMRSSEWVAPLAMDPTDPNTIYEGGDNVYKTTNGAVNTYDDFGDILQSGWTAVTNHQPGDPAVTDATGREYNVTTVAVAPSDHNVVYAGYGNGYLEMSNDGGQTWSQISPANNVWTDPNTARNNWITGITVNPNNPHDIYVTQSGYRPLHYASQGHVWHNPTTNDPINGSANDWVDLTSNSDPNNTPLPNAPVNGLALTDDGKLVAASDVGVFESSGDGNWVNLGTGLPTVEVVDVKIAGGVVFAATHGRGTWELSLTQGTNTASKVAVNTTSAPVGTPTSLVGRVVDANNYPVANQSVDIAVDGKKVATVKTAYDGNFSLDNYVTKAKLGKSFAVTATVTGTSTSSTSTVNVTTAPVANISMVVSNRVTAGTNFTISGQVTDAFKNPVANAWVDLFIDNNDYTYVQTDANGNYSYDVVAPTQLKDDQGNLQNSVSFWVAWQQNEGVTSKQQTVTFVPDAPANATLTVNGQSSIAVYSKTATTLRGVLTDQYNNTIANSKVVLTMNGHYWKSVTTDANGAFSVLFTPVGSGSYTFTAGVQGACTSSPVQIRVVK